MFFISKTSKSNGIADVTDTQDSVVETVTHEFLYKYCKANAVLGVTLNPDNIRRVSNTDLLAVENMGMLMSDVKMTITNHRLTLITSFKPISTLVIPYGVYSIGRFAMRNIDKWAVTTIVFPSSLTYIDYSTFYNMPNLEKVVIPSSVEFIGGSAFSKCPKLKVEFEDVNKITFGENAFDKHNCELQDDVYYLGKTAMRADNTAQYIKIKEGITHIAPKCFEACRKLVKVDLPDTLTHIGENSFQGATKLKEVNIPASVKSIGQACFASCVNLTEVYIPDNVETMGADVFRSCKRLKSVRLSPNVKKVECYFNKCAALEEIVVPEGVESINSLAFGCPELKCISLPSTLKYIRIFVATDCDKLIKFVFKSHDCATDKRNAEMIPLAKYTVNFASDVTVFIPKSVNYGGKKFWFLQRTGPDYIMSKYRALPYRVKRFQ